MLGPDLRRAILRRLELLGLATIALALAAASAVTWKTIDGPLRPIAYSAPTIPRPDPGRDGLFLTCRLDETSGPLDELGPIEPGPGRPEGFAQDDPAPPGFSAPADPPMAALLPGRDEPPPADRRVRIGDDRGRSLVARVHGGADSRVVILPDGSLGWPNGMIFTDEPFRPFSSEEMARDLGAGPYRHFQVLRTEHFVVFFTSSPAFARDSATLLESLYRGLSRGFRDRGIAVHDAEFPLVAVIFRNEAEFRDHKDVPGDVQAYYEVLSNRIFFYETRCHEPETAAQAAMRKPQTVAHEGTHQILQNIGVQARLARWPAWLVEGLAEFCAPAATARGEWAGCGRPNLLHLATLRELDDPLADPQAGPKAAARKVGHAPGRDALADLFAKADLSPTDYATSWAVVHYLATRRAAEFDEYLRRMSRVPPSLRATPAAQEAEFRAAFEDGADIGRLSHRHAMSQRCGEPLPYYAATFEQAIDDDQVRRGTYVSQSPLILRQWIESLYDPTGPEPAINFEAFPTRARAFQAVDLWAKSR